METKTLIVPRIETLDTIDTPDGISHVLDTSGTLHSISCCNWMEQYPYRPLAGFVAAHSGKNLYIDFLVRCNYLRAVNYADQSAVSEDSCVEVFLQPKPDGEYWNFEFNCIGAINASHRLTRPEPVRLCSTELASVKRYPTCGTKPFCEVEGFFTWNLLVVIPLGLIGIENAAPGTMLRGNFYKCASAASQPHFLSWNPIETPTPDFHRPEFFGNIILE
ncbi:MAG: hypothetical protein K2F78_01490 [Muribaculaceae bacterium]|nr:hypothetical protein [Muribaculaceae bacterium]